MKKNEVTRRFLWGSISAVCAVLALAGVAWAAGGDGEVHNAWLPEDNWKALNFAVLALVLFFIGKKVIPPLLRSRAKGIEEEIDELEKKKAEAEKTLAEYQAKFKNLDQESKQIVEDYIKQGEEAKKRILAEAEAQAEKLEDMAKRNIEQEFKAAKAKLQQEVVEKAMEQAEKVIKKSIKAKDQDKLVDAYLKKVEA